MPLHAGANRQAEKRRLGSYIGWADCEKEWERASASFRLASRKKVGLRRADTVTRCFLLHLVVEGFFLIFFFFYFAGLLLWHQEYRFCASCVVLLRRLISTNVVKLAMGTLYQADT